MLLVYTVDELTSSDTAQYDFNAELTLLNAPQYNYNVTALVDELTLSNAALATPMLLMYITWILTSGYKCEIKLKRCWGRIG